MPILLEIKLTYKKILKLFSLISFLFLSIYYLSFIIDMSNNYFFTDYLRITSEKNIPTFFSFLIMALLASVYYLLYKARSDTSLLIISIFFFYLGLDDMFQIHENLGSSAGEFITEEAISTGFSSYYWQAIFMPLFALFGLFIIYKTIKLFLEKKSKLGIFLLLIGFFCYAIAIGMDYYEGLGTNLFWLLEIFDSLYYDDIVNLMRATEEAIEMLGGTFILSSLLILKPINITIR